MSASTTSMLEHLMAREAIRDALCRYSRGVDRLDAETAQSAYHDDAIDDHGVHVGSAAEFVDWVIPLLRDNYLSTSHILGNQLIEIDGDVAHVETYYVAVQVHDRTGRTVEERVTGRYIDRMECRGGEWRIARRTVIIDSHNASEVQPWSGASDLAKMHHGRRDRTDMAFDGHHV